MNSGPFIASSIFGGPITGYVFRTGPQGNGYYWDGTVQRQVMAPNPTGIEPDDDEKELQRLLAEAESLEAEERRAQDEHQREMGRVQRSQNDAAIMQQQEAARLESAQKEQIRDFARQRCRDLGIPYDEKDIDEKFYCMAGW
jgi:hypothetical protein